MNDATDRLRRLLSVIPLFAESDYITREDLEKRTGVDTAVLLEDLRVVTERLDTPGGFVEDLRVEVEADRISVHSSHFLRPMRITVSELCALELGLAMLRAATPPDDGAPIARARAKLRSAIVGMPASQDESWQAAAPSAPQDGVLGAIGRAAGNSCKVRISYHSGKATSATSRVIHPYYVVFSHGAWYVIAHCEQSRGLRFFRADRIESAELADESFSRPEVLPVSELIPMGKPFHGGDGEMLVVRYSPRVARWIAEREGLTPDADGHLIVTHGLAEEEWALRHVLQYGPEAEVLSPPRIRRQVRERLEKMVD
jgi:proteasome accessory factor C